jgi:hypothetical protein
VKYKESIISANHNYLVNGMLTSGFVIGDPNSREGFYFLADLVLPGESTPRISARILDDAGRVLYELEWNRLRRNPGKCTFESIAGGFRIISSKGDTTINVTTKAFANGYLTMMRARLIDEIGDTRIEPFGKSIRVYGEADLALDKPFGFDT